MANESINDVREVQLSESKGVSLSTLFFLLKKSILMILILTVLGGCLGLFVSMSKPTTYVASKSVLLKATVVEESTQGYQQVNTTAGRVYMPIVKEFIQTQVVINLANVIFSAKINGLPYTSAEFTDMAYAIYDNTFLPEHYDTRLKKSGYIRLSSIALTTSEEDYNYFINVAYGQSELEGKTKEQNNQSVQDKLDAYIEAARIFVGLYEDPTAEIKKSKFFQADISFNTNLNPVSNVTATTYSKNDILLGAIVGLAVSLVIMVVIYLLDDSVRSKEELERLTGVKVIAVIEDIQSVKSKKRKSSGKKNGNRGN